MWLFSRKAKPAEPGRFDSPQPAADLPSFTPLTATLIELPSDGHVAVHGESHYQPALTLTVGGRVAGDNLDQHIPVRAVLIPEPDNHWDSHAVRVDVIVGDRMVTVGYLPRETAAEYQPNLLTLLSKNMIGSCPARVAGGGAKFYGIHLNLCYPEKLIIVVGDFHPMVAEQRDGRAILRAECSRTVTKEKPHQNALAPYAPDSSETSRQALAELNLCTAKSGKYQGFPAIEVRLGGRRVGELSHVMSERYLPAVNEILDCGLKPMSKAEVVTTKNGLEVELMMPSTATDTHLIRI